MLWCWWMYHTLTQRRTQTPSGNGWSSKDKQSPTTELTTTNNKCRKYRIHNPIRAESILDRNHKRNPVLDEGNEATARVVRDTVSSSLRITTSLSGDMENSLMWEFINITIIRGTFFNEFDCKRIGNYINHVHNRDDRGCGAAIYVNQNLQRHWVPISNLRSLETSIVYDKTGLDKIDIISGYKSPNNILRHNDPHNRMAITTLTIIERLLRYCKNRLWKCKDINENRRSFRNHRNRTNMQIRSSKELTFYEIQVKSDIFDIALT